MRGTRIEEHDREKAAVRNHRTWCGSLWKLLRSSASSTRHQAPRSGRTVGSATTLVCALDSDAVAKWKHLWETFVRDVGEGEVFLYRGGRANSPLRAGATT
jgi:hypothetical protein